MMSLASQTPQEVPKIRGILSFLPPPAGLAVKQAAAVTFTSVFPVAKSKGVPPP